jgi:ABC-type sugar transport system ATPase subunit
MVLSDRIAVMNNGVVQQFAEPMTIYREPANQFVAAFIGSPQMNFLPGSAVPGGNGDDRLVGVRPHDLTPGNGNSSDGFTLTGELALIEPAGPIHFLDVLVGDLMVKATCTDPGNLGLGEKLTLSAPAQTVYLFDRESGARI